MIKMITEDIPERHELKNKTTSNNIIVNGTNGESVPKQGKQVRFIFY